MAEQIKKTTEKAEKTHVYVRGDREKLLENIENNASKGDFVGWLNNQHGGAYSDSADWSNIKKAVLGSNVSASELQSYAASLSSDADVKKLLRDVEKQTSEAQVVADKLSLLSTLKKFAVATGGACLLSAIILIGIAAGIWFDTITIGEIERYYLTAAALLLGVLQFFAGILLVTE